MLGLAGRAVVVGILTAAALAGAAVLRPRLPETAEALGALGAVLVVGDAAAARATGLAGADAVPGLLYAAVVAAAAGLLLGAIGAVAGLRSGTITAALLVPAAPVLAGLYLADARGTGRPSVLPIVAGLLGAALVAAGRGLLPAGLPAEARVAQVAAAAGTASAALLLVWLPASAEVTVAALAGVAVLAVQALADGSRRRGGGAHASVTGASGSGWSGAAGAAAVLTAVLGALTLFGGPDAAAVADLFAAGDRTGAAPGNSWTGAATAAIAAALAATALLIAARHLPGAPLGRRLPGPVRASLRPPGLAAGAALALAVAALPVVAGALGVLAALVRASSVPWRVRPGALIGSLPLDPWSASTTRQFVLAAGLVVPGLLLVGAGAGAVAERTEKVAAAARRGGAGAVVAGLVVLCTLPELRVVTGAALLVRRGGRDGRSGRADAFRNVRRRLRRVRGARGPAGVDGPGRRAARSPCWECWGCSPLAR